MINFIKRKNEQGVVLILSMMILAMILILGTTFFKRQMAAIEMSAKEPKSLMAAFAADCGIERALYKIQKEDGQYPENSCIEKGCYFPGVANGEINLDNGSSYYVIVPVGSSTIQGTTPDYISIRSIGSFLGISRSFEITTYTARP